MIEAVEETFNMQKKEEKAGSYISHNATGIFLLTPCPLNAQIF